MVEVMGRRLNYLLIFLEEVCVKLLKSVQHVFYFLDGWENSCPAAKNDMIDLTGDRQTCRQTDRQYLPEVPLSFQSTEPTSRDNTYSLLS